MNDANSRSMTDLGRNARIDPITLSIVWSKLMSIVEEMGGTLRRTAYSPAPQGCSTARGA
ncbi:MAG: hydantoinase B/oxoprolinase family protein [Alphaproteobacteria bacterium]|nr:hydantoinase B/oxoprolinase family protein [Alphaproteobacteria bacterium]